jgi:hypothetical protein
VVSFSAYDAACAKTQEASPIEAKVKNPISIPISKTNNKHLLFFFPPTYPHNPKSKRAIPNMYKQIINP